MLGLGSAAMRLMRGSAMSLVAVLAGVLALAAGASLVVLQAPVVWADIFADD